MGITEMERKQKIYEEILNEARENDNVKHPDEFSVNDFAREAGVGRDYAVTLLKQKVANGVLKVRKTGRGIYYSIV